MYEAEFDAILEEQERFWGEPPLDADQKAALYKALFFQHPFAVSEERRAKAPARANLHRAPGVHPCPYEKGETGCPRSDWLAQRFRILKEVQSLRISEEHRQERPLTPDEVIFTVDLLSSNGESSFSSLGKKLIHQFKLAEPLEFNLARGGRAKIKGNEVEATLARAFGKKTWQTMLEDDQRQLRQALVESASAEQLDDILKRSGLEDGEKREKLCRYRPKDDGYLSFSKSALEKILPLMEEGMAEHLAIAQVYPDTFEADGLLLLPSLVGMQLDERIKPKIPPQIQNELTNLTNPIVRRALVEVRKVVNALVREHGKPARIVIEMAREMKQGHDARVEHSLKMNRRNKQREDARDSLKKLLNGAWPRRSDVDRWILWEQQKHVCIYCGKGIATHEVANADVEVDHILPRWQSLDDSMNNKVLCCGNCNAGKGNRTPVAWRGKDSAEMVALLKRAWSCVERKDNPGGMPFGKIKRFETESVDADQFAQSQLNDTRYISKLVSSYLLLLFPTEEHVGQMRVQTSRGNLTAHLRRMWGVNGIIPPLVQAHGEIVPGFVEHEGWNEKVRVDHRHHAVDALVVALSSAAFMKRLQDCWRKDDDPKERSASFEPPWKDLRNDAIKAIEAINISHRPMRRKRGALHKETYYGKIPGEEGQYVTRKRLDELTKSMIGDIRDAGVQQAIENRLKERGWDGKSSKLPKDWHREELFLPTAAARPDRTPRKAHPVRRVRITTAIGRTIQLGDKGHRFAQSGSNFCLQVIGSDAPPHTQFRVVSRFDANRPGDQQAVPAGMRLVGTLHNKDSVLVQIEGISEPVLAVVQTISGRSEVTALGLDVRLRDAKDSRPASEGNKTPLARINSHGKWDAHAIQSVSVDPLGRILPGRSLSHESPSPTQVDD
jgi:CRISPR-associated endonuclease Csn1